MLRFRSLATAGCCALAWLLAPVSPATAQNDVKSVTLDTVKKRGQLICGVDTGIPGYAFQDSKGEWQGLDVAYCRALADASGLTREGQVSSAPRRRSASPCCSRARSTC